MNKEQKQVENNNIISICEENGIEYDLNKLDFIEKDTGEEVNLNVYTLLVFAENDVLKLDGFYSFDKINSYLQQAQADKYRNIIYEDNKEMIGYILVDNENNFKRYTEFYELHKKVDIKRQKLEELKPNNKGKQENKYVVFNYLKEQKYVIDMINMEGQRLMHLDTKGETMCSVVKNITKNTKQITSSCFIKHINMFGFKWEGVKAQCYLTVDKQTFEEYYLPFTKTLARINCDESFQFLKQLYDFYQIPLPKTKDEENLLQAKLRVILGNKLFLAALLLEKHTQYPRNIR